MSATTCTTTLSTSPHTRFHLTRHICHLIRTLLVVRCQLSELDVERGAADAVHGARCAQVLNSGARSSRCGRCQCSSWLCCFPLWPRGCSAAEAVWARRTETCSCMDRPKISGHTHSFTTSFICKTLCSPSQPIYLTHTSLSQPLCARIQQADHGFLPPSLSISSHPLRRGSRVFSSSERSCRSQGCCHVLGACRLVQPRRRRAPPASSKPTSACPTESSRRKTRRHRFVRFCPVRSSSFCLF